MGDNERGKDLEDLDLITTEETSQTQEPEDDLLPAVIRSEVNFLQYPFFALSWKGLKDKTKTEFRLVTERGEQKAELLWEVTANAEYGYPTPFDRRVSRAIDALINEILQIKGYPLSNPIRFSIYHIGQLMGIKNSGRIYKEIKESIERIVATTVKSAGSFFIRDEQTWLHDIFHLYERAVFKGKKLPNGIISDANCLWLSEPYQHSINARYVKPLDYKYLASLKSDLASRLYELLGLKFYGLPPDREYIRIGYLNLCQALPITPQNYYSDARQILDPAHKELIRTGFLAKVAYQRPKGKRDFNILYYPGERAKKELRGEFATKQFIEEQLELPLTDEREGGSVGLSEIAQELYSRGLSKNAAIKLSERYPESLIREKLEIFDYLVESNSELISKNRAGWLRRAIEEDWQPTDAQLQVKEAQARAQTENERQARWIKHRNELIEQEIRDWDKTPPEERIKGRLEFWLAGFQLKKQRVSQEEVEAKKKELISEISKTEEKRRSYLASKYPINPPEDWAFSDIGNRGNVKRKT